MENMKKYITIDSEIQNGQPVFTGTRVPIETLFWHLEEGISLMNFWRTFQVLPENRLVV